MTRRRLWWGVLAILAAVAAAAAPARQLTYAPDVLALIVVAAGLSGGSTRGALVGLLAGWITDLMPPGGVLLGAGALSYAAVGALAGRGHREGRQPRWFFGGVALGCVALFAVLEAFFGWVAPRGGAPWPGVDFAQVGITAGVTVLLIVLIAPALAAIDVRLRPRG